MAGSGDASGRLSVWVGNIPLPHASEGAVREAVRLALVEEQELAEGEDMGCTRCTVRVKPDKPNGSWALLSFKDQGSVDRVAVLKVSVVTTDGGCVSLLVKPAQIEQQLARNSRRVKRSQSYGTGALAGLVQRHHQQGVTDGEGVLASPTESRNRSLWVGDIPITLTDEAKLQAACEAAGMIGVVSCNIRTKPEKPNGSWAMLGFRDEAAMAVASKIAVTATGDKGGLISLRISLPSGEKKLVVSAWVGNIPREFANENALVEALSAEGMLVKKCTIRVKVEKVNGSWALLTFADEAASDRFFSHKGTVTLPGDTPGTRVSLRMQEFRGEKVHTMEAQTLVNMHLMQLNGKIAWSADSDSDLVPSLPDGKRYHFFLCHHQGSGGDQCLALCRDLKRMGFQVWYDNDVAAVHRNLDGMRAGVKLSMCLLIFLSGRVEKNGSPSEDGEYEGPFSRFFCQVRMQNSSPYMTIRDSMR